MSRASLKMPGANTTVPGSTALFKLPPGMRYHELELIFSGITLAQMTEIRLLANGKPIHRYSAELRNKVNLFDGRADAATTGILKIPLDRYNLKNREAEEETAFNTGANMPIRSLQLEIDMASGSYTPVFDLYADQSENSPAYTGKVLWQLLHPRNASGAGESQFSDLHPDLLANQALNRLVAVPESGEISKAQIERDGRILFDRTTALNEAIQADGVRVPQAGMFVIDRTERGFGGDPVIIRGANDFRYRMTFSQATDVDFLVETVGVIGG